MNNPNTVIRNLRETIIKDIEESGLPIEIARLTVAEIYNIINNECNRVLEAESNPPVEEKEGENENVKV